MNQTQLAETAPAIIEKINAEYTTFITFGEKSEAALLDQINKGRELGLHLQELKRITPHGQFSQLFLTDSHGKENPKIDSTLSFSQSHGATFMRLARNHPEAYTTLADGVKCMKDACILAGALPESSRAPQKPSEQSVGPFSTAQQMLRDWMATMNKEVEKEPAENWQDEQILSVLGTLEETDPLRQRLQRIKQERGI